MKTRLTIVLLLFTALLTAQNISLFECYKSARENHPLLKNKSELQIISELNQKNIQANWLPNLELNAGFNYISEVMNFGDMQLPAMVNIEFPEMPKDQYKFSLDINQPLYDGGAVSKSKTLELAKLNIEQQNEEVNIYAIYEQINRLYFAMLLTEESKKLLDSYLNILDARMKDLDSGIENGLVLPESKDALLAEMIKIKQQLTELDIKRNYISQILSALTGKQFNENSAFSLPEIALPAETTIQRPETDLFSLHNQLLTNKQELLLSQRMPKAFAFASLGYGNPPGSNYLRDEFDTYYMLGVGVKWNIFDWNKTKRSRQVIEHQKSLSSNKKENFDRNINIALNNNQSEIEKIESLIKSDRELISIREKMTQNSSEKLKNGTLSSSDYVSDLNAEKQAKINLEIHKLQLVQSGINHLTISGQIIQFIK